LAAVVVLPDLDRVALARIDLGEVLLADELLEAPLAVPEIEVAQPVLRLALAVGDEVELLLHRGGEVVVDEVREVALHQLGLGERRPRRPERGALLPHVAPFLPHPPDAPPTL